MWKWKRSLYNRYVDLETSDHELKYLFLEVTRRCNLSCIHCGSDCSRDLSMKEMTLESWISIIDYFKKVYNPVFVITGGEPLVREDLFEITSHLKTIGARWGMVTNGFSLNSDRIKILTDHGIEAITLSVDGLEKEHLYIRRNPDSFNRVERALDLIKDSDIERRDAVTCVYPGNLKELDSIGEFLTDKGVNSWRLFRIFPKGKAKGNKKLILDFNESNDLVDWISNNRKRYLKRGVNLAFSCEGYIGYKRDREVRDEPFFCRAGINIASILSDGTVTGCNNNGPDYYQGNLISDDFKTLWENEFKIFRDKSWLKTGKCLECSEWKYCRGGSIHLRDKDVKGPNFCYLKD